MISNSHSSDKEFLTKVFQVVGVNTWTGWTHLQNYIFYYIPDKEFLNKRSRLQKLVSHDQNREQTNHQHHYKFLFPLVRTYTTKLIPQNNFNIF